MSSVKTIAVYSTSLKLCILMVIDGLGMILFHSYFAQWSNYGFLSTIIVYLIAKAAIAPKAANMGTNTAPMIPTEHGTSKNSFSFLVLDYYSSNVCFVE